MLEPVNRQLSLLVGVKPGTSGFGSVGEQGPAGPMGPQGPEGPMGPQGPVGPQGPAGTNGTNGTNGINGAPGVNGAQGPAGPAGPAGQTTRVSNSTVTLGVGSKTFAYTETASNIGWAVGTRLRAFLEAGRYMEGVVTEVSSTSVTFLSDYFTGSGNGSAWFIGIIGDRGTNGTNGTNGADGLKGDKGDTGPQGPVGPAGATGAKGDQGDPGPEGSIGPEGPAGTVDPILLDAKENKAEKGAPDGYASLNSVGKVPASQLPSTGDVIEYTNMTFFPATGEVETIYIALDTDTSYIWDDDASVYTPQTTVGSLPSNVGFKVPCRLVATTNIDIATGGFMTIDGKMVANKYRILLTAQTNPAENGIYVAAAGPWVRANDANVIAECRAALVSIWQGTTYGGSLWFTTMDQNDVLGTTPMNWFRVTHTGNIVSLIDDLLGSNMWRSEGADGRTILSGTSAPTTEGEDGDFYLRTSTSMLYGPKTAGSWPAGVSLIGAQGPQGIQGETGPMGPTGATGATGSAGNDFPSYQIINSTGAIVLTNSHFSGNKHLEIDSASAVNVTINTGLTGVEPLIIEQKGSGQITLTGSATILSRNGLKSGGQYALLTVIPKGSDTYLIGGDVTV